MNKKLFLIPLVITLLDQLSKWLVTEHINLNTAVEVLPVLDLVHVVNPGAAFSMFANLDYANNFLMPIALIAALGIGAWLYLFGDRESKINQYALLFVMAGAIGNFIDRVRFGHVIDFISVHYQQWYYPSFNLADSSITIGALLLVLGLFLPSSQDKNAKATNEPKSSDGKQGKKT